MFRKFRLFLLVIIFGLVLSGCAITIKQKEAAKSELPVITIAPTVQPTQPLINQVNEENLPSVTIAQYNEPTLQPTQQVNNDEGLIKEAMAIKHNKAIADTNVTISKKTADYASGGVQFAGEMGGGWFLAAKTGSDWQIVQDGNGTVSCALVKPYNFPVDMVSECWDDATQQLIKF